MAHRELGRPKSRPRTFPRERASPSLAQLFRLWHACRPRKVGRTVPEMWGSRSPVSGRRRSRPPGPTYHRTVIDLRLVREQPDVVRASQRARGADESLVDALLEAD